MDGVVFHPALTKPDILVLQNLAADIRDQSASEQRTQLDDDYEPSVERRTPRTVAAEGKDNSSTSMAGRALS